jgi:hypothetical protein
MSTIKDYSIIETEWINGQILLLENKNERLIATSPNYLLNLGKISILKEIKSKLKPLTPIVENAFRQGERFARHDIREIETGEKNLTLDLPEYINNTIIE